MKSHCYSSCLLLVFLLFLIFTHYSMATVSTTGPGIVSFFSFGKSLSFLSTYEINTNALSQAAAHAPSRAMKRRSPGKVEVGVGLSEWVLSERTGWMTEKSDRQEVRGDVPDDDLRMNKTPSTRELSLSRHPTLLRGCDKRSVQAMSYIGWTPTMETTQLMTRHIFLIQPFIRVELIGFHSHPAFSPSVYSDRSPR